MKCRKLFKFIKIFLNGPVSAGFVLRKRNRVPLRGRTLFGSSITDPLLRYPFVFVLAVPSGFMEFVPVVGPPVPALSIVSVRLSG